MAYKRSYKGSFFYGKQVELGKTGQLIFLSIFLIFFFAAVFYFLKHGKVVVKKEGNSLKKKSSKKNQDIYHSVGEVKEALRKLGLESSNLIFGIDYTSSNMTQGIYSFNGNNLHSISRKRENPYQCVIRIMAKTLSNLDEDDIIPVFGFGDIHTKNHNVFAICPDDNGRWCHGINEVLFSYTRVTPNIKLSGPTNFAPIIYKAIEICQQSAPAQYHILVIITDGQVEGNDKKETINAIVKASKTVPLSIIIIGVGDGPFDNMELLDDEIPNDFDNVQFVDFEKVQRQSAHTSANTNNKTGDQIIDDTFALAAMMEIPQQYRKMRELLLL